jgi:bifunctional enzyme CysN/CysC
MAHRSDLIATDIEAYLAEHERKDLLRLLTCGSVDDGKSTLIGRLLHDSNVVYADHLAALESDSVTSGTTGGRIDLALLMDGLKAEREQGITIDVAYRYFSTARRKFIIADTPGHVQYTRNMVTGASTAQLAVILIDARHGVLDQTRRHSYVASLLGIRHVVVAVNKMDLVDWSEDRFEEITAEFEAFSGKLAVTDVTFIPMSALHGDNVVERSTNMPWYQGPPLLYHLEHVHIASDRNLIDPRFPVQWVVRPQSDEYPDYRGYAGKVAAGIFRPGDPVVALPAGLQSRISSIDVLEGTVDEAFPPMSVTIRLEDDIDVSRGTMLARPNNRPHVGQDLDAMVCWMSERPASPRGMYAIKHTTRSARAMITDVVYRLDVNSTHRDESATSLTANDIGRITLRSTEPLCYDAYRQSRTTGSFILIDEATDETVAAGMLHEPA